jgi:hypothetical protein
MAHSGKEELRHGDADGVGKRESSGGVWQHGTPILMS